MGITQQGALNTTALIVPGLYVQIVPPQNTVINGVPTDVYGAVGTAQWGPVNAVVVIGSMQEYAAAFGAIQARQYDLGTEVAIAVQQGAANFRCVRVTDGTDTAASLTLLGSIVFTAKYTGSLGNNIKVIFGTGSAANTWRVTVGLPGLTPEVYDNISGSGANFWANLVSAINSGNGALRGASMLVTAATGSGSATPVAGTFAFASGSLGTDGAGAVTDAKIIGNDLSAVRTGMYALRSQGCGVVTLAGVNAFTSGATMLAFGLSESLYVVGAGPSGDTITNAIAVKAQAGIDSYALKLMFGDWVYWNDTVNGVTRLVSPAPFAAGRLANLTPNQSSLNKQLQCIQGTQKSGQPGSGAASVYAQADLEALFSAGIDVIGNPSPGGPYWSVLCGHNTSSDATINGDNYTRMTNYIATTLAGAMGIYVGEVITPDLFSRIRGSIKGFLSTLLGAGLLSKTQVPNANSSVTLALPYGVVCDITNNPDDRTSLGYVQADVQVKYQGINEKFIVNIEGGTTVVILASSAN